MNWKWTYAISIAVTLILVAIYFAKTPSTLSPDVTSSVGWGGATLLLCLTFMLGAAQTPRQFLVFFGMGAFGAGMGYLVGAWLTPTGDSNPLDQVRNIVAGVLSGVVGTKLLSLWDDLVDRPADGGKPPILTGSYFIPIVLWLVGFTVSLSAFYTVRTAESGEVRITYLPHEGVRLTGGGHLGILAGTKVTFAAAANSPDDVRTAWSFQLDDPCSALTNDPKFDKDGFAKQMMGSFNTSNGELTAPGRDDIQKWVESCPGSVNWILSATSVRDQAKHSNVRIKFCKTKEDCSLDSGAKGDPKDGPKK